MKKLITIVSVFLVFLLLSCTQTPEERLQSTYQEGLDQLSRQEFVRADSTFAQISKEFVATSLGRYGLALSKERRLLYFDAIYSYVEVIKGAPSLAPLNRAIGRAFRRVGDLDESAKAYSNYANVDPDNPMAQFESARAHFANSKPELAQNALERAVGEGLDDYLADLFRARLAFAMNQIDSAEIALSRGLADVGSDPVGYREIADYYEYRGMSDSAMYYSRKSMEMAKSDIDLKLDHFERALRLRYFFDARKSLEQFKKSNNSDQFISALEVAFYRATADGSKASKKSMEYRQLYPEALTPIVWDIHTRWMIKDSWSVFEDRERIKQKMKKENYDPSFQAFMQGRMSLEFSSYTELDSDLDDLHKSAGWKLKQREHMIEELHLHSMNGRPDSVDAIASVLLSSHDLQPVWLSEIGDIYADKRARDYDRAVELYTDALSIWPMYIPAYEHRVAMETEMHRWEEALKVMETYPQFIKLVPTSAMQKVTVLLAQKKWDDAISLAKQTLPQLAGDLDRFSAIEKTLWQNKQFDDATAIMGLLRDLSAENPDGLAMVASYYIDRNDAASATTLIDEGLKLDPDNTDLLVQKARVSILNGNRDEGLALLEELYGKEPGNSEVLLYLSRTMSSEKKLLRKAVNIARSAVFFDQLSTKVRLNLSYIYWQMERFDLAKGEARIAVSMDRTNPEAYYWFGRALFKLGDKSASDNLTKAIEFGLSGNSLSDAQEMLNRL